MKQKLQRILIYSPACPQLPHCNIPHHSGAFVTTDKPILTHHYHPKFIVSFFLVLYIPWVWTRYNNMYPSVWYHIEYFHCPKNLLCLYPQHLGIHWSLYCFLSFLECYVAWMRFYVAFSDSPLSLNNMYLFPPCLFIA